MNRELMIKQLNDDAEKIWDIVIIGGGATGLGAAVDSASRGFKTLLIEQSDFAKGTSSKSTKLIHGGVRYLAQGDVSLVFEALHERGLLMQNAPHLVRNRKFVIPIYEWWEGPFYNIGMKVYDLMAGKLGLGPSQKISREDAVRAIPNLDRKGLTGGVIYFDGQFDDSRMAVSLAQTAVDYGGVVLNYVKAVGFTKDSRGLINSVKLIDSETRQEFIVRCKTVINAAGIFVESIKAMDGAGQINHIILSRGSHLVLDNSFLRSDSAIMIPHTSDGRVLFAVPWYDKVIIGTTDKEASEPDLEPLPHPEEIEFLLQTSSKYLEKDPRPEDILSVFAGLRPLAFGNGRSRYTKDISRKHQITVSVSGLISITGGKWTTYRKMAEDLIDNAILVGGLKEKKCITEHLPVHGYLKNTDFEDVMYFYGSDKSLIQEKIISFDASLKERIHPNLPYLKAGVVWAVRYEMARTVEDYLARRSRALLLNARASIVAAPGVATLMATELKKDISWIKKQVDEYSALASHYIYSY